MATTAAALLLLLLAAPAAYAVEHTVGDSAGWALGGDFDTWARGQKFALGDTLVFNYGSSHRVEQVNQADYTSCSAANALSSHSDGNTKIDLKTPGPMYFICSSLGHCSQGMKLQINVAGGAPSTPKTTPTSPSSSPPLTPATTPSPPADNSPATPSGPSTGSPSTPSGATGNVCHMTHVMLGVSIAIAILFAFAS